jgi:hypothetical protein
MASGQSFVKSGRKKLEVCRSPDLGSHKLIWSGKYRTFRTVKLTLEILDMENFRLLPGCCESILQIETSLLLYVVKSSLGMHEAIILKLLLKYIFLHLFYVLFWYLLHRDIIFCVSVY